MLKPFYQGKLDTFCAVYAVLNALRLTHGIRTLKARDILNETILNLAMKPALLHAVLNQNTDYIDLVDHVLAVQASRMPLQVARPFKNSATPDEFWQVCKDWVGESGQERHRAVVFRFLRHVTPEKPPLNRHWTTADFVKGDVLHLFDCSHEAEAILNIKKDSFVTEAGKVDKNHLLYIPPAAVRLVALPVR